MTFEEMHIEINKVVNDALRNGLKPTDLIACLEISKQEVFDMVRRVNRPRIVVPPPVPPVMNHYPSTE